MKDTIADRVKKHRDALRAAGLRPVQIWVPDTRRRGFAQECRRQSRRLQGDPQEKKVLKWLGKVASTEGWK
ncbi:MAG TPA: antitoxin MazE family protein [Terriglobia bacterium]|nr:antitoxin MazE family protein [Terriglobia bacterium]